MIFTDHWFLFFAAIFLPLYWALWHPLPRIVALLAACAWFHWHYAGPAGVLPIVILAAITYGCGLTRRPWLCHAGIAFCILGLVFYKYAAFLCSELLGAIDPAASDLLLARVHAWHPGAPPLAVSFFVFEFVHYLVDVGRGSAPLRRPDHFALFALFFPSLVAGPVKRYQPFIASLQAGLAGVNPSGVAAGLGRVALGFFKKLVLADNLAAILRFHEPGFTSLSAAGTWLFLGGLGARLLLDFSAYSDIAIGLARLLGVTLPENFNWPYLATNLRDFWARWHISLSSWIRDYVYIPLGGNRHGPGRRSANALIAFALCGLWHGAAWHFALWGLWHGTGLVVSSSYRHLLGPAGGWLAGLFARWPVLGWIPTTLYVAFGWLLFFYEPARAWAMAVKLVTFR